MKLAAILFACLIGTQAIAQSQYNGDLSFSLFYNSGENTQDGSQTLGYVRSRSSFDFSSKWGAQFDIGAGTIFGDSTEGTAGLHLFYNVNSNVSIGGFYNYEGFLTNRAGSSGNSIAHYGLELAYITEGFEANGYIGKLNFEQQSNRQIIGLDAEAAIPGAEDWNAIGGLHHTFNADDFYWYLGGEKELSDNLKLGARYSRDDGENIVGVFVDYRFGKGAKFDARGFSSSMLGDIN